MTTTRITRATKSDILSAARKLAETGTFTVARVETVLGVYGTAVRSLDVLEHVTAILTGSGLYVTDEAGTFAAA